jgi:hypothetical protein
MTENIDHVSHMELTTFLHLLPVLVSRRSTTSKSLIQNITQPAIESPVFLANKQVEGILSTQESVIVDDFHSSHPVRVEISSNLSKTDVR